MPGDIEVIPRESRADLAVRIPPGVAPTLVVSRLRRHLDKLGFDDIEVNATGGYPGSRTHLGDRAVRAMCEAYRDHGCEPEIWPLLASASPYYLFSEILGIPYVWGGLGRAGNSHGGDEYFTVDGLNLFEKSLVTFLYRFAEP